MMRAACVAALVVGASGCGSASRTYEVLVNQEEICRTFGSQPQACGRSNAPAVSMKVTVEDRGDGTAIIYGRSDSSAERTYHATVPHKGRYEVEERQDGINRNTTCENHATFILVLNVDDKGLDGGEESRTEETRKCNDFNEKRVTVRKREWKGSRLDGEDSSPVPGVNLP